jgi:alpha-L-fucosidase
VIYTHWGVYCYTATNNNATWNLYQAYRHPDSRSSKEFTEKFGAEEWADLFARSGAKFVGPVAEHHDGFYHVGHGILRLECSQLVLVPHNRHYKRLK